MTTTKHSISRRRAIGGAATMAGWLGSATSADAASQSGVLRIGLLGCPAKDSGGAGLLRNAASIQAQTQMAITSVWDADQSRAKSFANGSSSIAVADRFDKMVGKVDGVLISDPKAVAWHPQLVAPYLKAGIPVWIDGPLAPSMESAEAMLENAAKGKSALMAGTIEEFFPTVRFLHRKANDLAPITAAMAAVSTLGKTADKWAGVEGVNLLCSIFGTSAAKVSRIPASGKEPNYTITFDYRGLTGDRPVHVVVQGLPNRADRMWARLYGTDMIDRSHLLSDDAEEDWLNSFLPAALAMQQMFRRKAAPQDPSYLLAKAKLYLAACRSTMSEDGKEFAVPDLPNGWALENTHSGYLPDKLA